MPEKNLKMNLVRPQWGVGTKTWISFTIVFWLPVLTMVTTLFFLLKSMIQNETLDTARIYLQCTEDILGERANLIRELLVYTASSDATIQAMIRHDKYYLQKTLLDIGKKNPAVTFLYAVDENYKIITDKKGRSGNLLNIGNGLSQAILSGQTIITTELMTGSFFTGEDMETVKQINSGHALVQFVIHPIQGKERSPGALVAGILLSGDPWLGNTVFNRYGVEMAIFAGERIDSSRLHVSPSLPRNIWAPDQLIPAEIKNEIAFGKNFHGEISNGNGDLSYVVFKPLKDNKERIIGAIGLSIPQSGTNQKILSPILIATGITAIIGFIIAVAITFLVKHDITRPIHLLQDAMDSLGTGEITTKIDLKTGDEFETLSESFNKMATGILLREERLRKHYEVTKLLMSTIDLNDLLRRMLKIVAEVTESQLGIVYLLDDASNKFIPHAHYGTRSGFNDLDIDQGYPGLAVKEKHHILIKPGSGVMEKKIDFGFTQITPAEIAYIPLIYNDVVIGILILGSVESYSQEEVVLFDYLANQIAIALDSALLHKKVQELSITDNLTGLNNRHYLNRRLDEIWSKALRQNQPLSILLADLDNFKSINDTFGHKCGDDVLAATGKVFRESVRKEDLVARYGGEEFVVIMENTTAEKAVELAERIRKEMSQIQLNWMKQSITVSIGIAVYPDAGSTDPVGLIQAADMAMYTSKTSGKDRVTLFVPGMLN